MFHFSAPGKLFLLGEWAILNKGNTGVVAAVDRRVHSEITDSKEGIVIKLDDFDKEIRCTYEDELKIEESQETMFIKSAIETTFRFLKEKGIAAKPFTIRTWGEETIIEGKKVGFGSSAASTVAVVASLLAYHNYSATADEIFKLSIIADYFAQGKLGSGFDVAASTYGGVFVYRRFDAGWLAKVMEKNKLADVVKSEWPALYIEPLEAKFKLCVAWTGESASTTDMIKKMKIFTDKNKKEYERIMLDISDTAISFVDALKVYDKDGMILAVKENRKLLEELTEKSGVNIETDKLHMLGKIAEKCGGAGKLSGAGGGDCGIAICFDDAVAECIKREWNSSGLHILDVKIDSGVKRE